MLRYLPSRAPRKADRPRNDYEPCGLCEEEDDEEGEEIDISVDVPIWLPRWFLTSYWGVPSEVKELMKEKRLVPNETMPEDKRYKLTMFDISGPPVLLLWMATLIQWPFFMFLPWIAFYFTECNGLGMPHYATWVWLFPLPILVLVVGIELWCFTYTIVPVVQWLGNMTTPLRSKPSFGFWFYWHLSLSLCSHTDLVTQGFLLASVCRWFGCEGWDQIAQIWEDVWENSIFAWITPGENLRFILIFAWITTIIQLPLFIASALPARLFCCKYVDFDCRSEKEGYNVFSCWPQNVAECQWTTSHIWHADALKTLALLNRMVLVQEGQHQLQLERAKHTKHDLNRSTQILKMELRQMIPRIVLLNFLQNCTKLEVQTTIFSLGRMVMKAHLNWQCLFCILIAHITSANDLFQICLRAKKIAEARKESAASDEPADDIGTLGMDRPPAESRAAPSSAAVDVRSASRNLDARPQAIDSMDWMLAFVWCAALLCFLVQLHSFGKLVGAFICEDAIWNFPDRCVDVDANWRSSPGG
ncbi:unnamed protein product [Durusdinium trenchii]|uniref:Glycerophosphocholine acyltransferase 1 n=1 Tax=Durusdinium trenchii TaxID=1381693 RepID=A0ABP0R1A7_9DINO